MKFIDADACYERNKNSIYDTTDLKEILFYEPEVDVKEIVHGRWEFDSYTAKYGKPYRCSVCGEEHLDTYQYCPDCGATMDNT